MMGKIESGRILNDEDSWIFAAASERSLRMRLKNRGRGNTLRAPEAVGGFSGSPGAGGVGHTGSRMGTQLCHERGQATREAAVTKLGIIQFVNGPGGWLWEGARMRFHTGVSVPIPV